MFKRIVYGYFIYRTLVHKSIKELLRMSKKIAVLVTDLFEDVEYTDPAEDFDALFLPGGFSPDILRADDQVVAFTKSFMDEGKPVMAICHGPQLLINAETLKGRDVTGFKSIAIDLKNAGANFHDKEVVVCGNQLVTSRTPDDMEAFVRESVNVLK